MPRLDLTPFGFTPTENLIYEALRALGPASGYAVAKQAGIARANAYQALDGLVGKGAAALVGENPKLYRGVQPQALLATIAAAEAEQLDALEQAVTGLDREGEASLVALAGLRAVQEVATRTIVRDPGEVVCLAPPDVLDGLTPALRKRVTDGRPLEVWVVGEGDVSLPDDAAGTVGSDMIEQRFGGPVVLLAGSEAALAALSGDEPSGYWTSRPLLTGLIRATLDQLTT